MEKKSKGIIKSYLICFKKYFKFKGRATRKEFWSFQLLNNIIAFLLTFIFQPLTSIYAILTFIPNLSVTSRRLHDVNRSFLWAIAPMIFTLAIIIIATICKYLEISSSLQLSRAILTIIGFLWVFYSLLLLFWFCTKSDNESNKYGDIE